MTTASYADIRLAWMGLLKFIAIFFVYMGHLYPVLFAGYTFREYSFSFYILFPYVTFYGNNRIFVYKRNPKPFLSSIKSDSLYYR